MSIQRKIAMAISLLAILLIIILGSVSSKIAKDALIERSNEFLESILTRNEYEVEQNIFAVEKMTQTLSDEVWATYNPNRGSTDTSYRDNYLNKIATSVKLSAELSPSKSAFILFLDPSGSVNASIWFADKNGDLIPTLESDMSLLNHIQIEDMLTNTSGKDSVEWINHTQGETLGSCFSTLIFDDNSMAIVGVDLNGSSILSRLDASHFMNSGFLYILDDAGRVIYHPDYDRDKHFSDNELFIQHNTYLILENSLSNNWHLYVSVSREDLFRDLDRIDQLIVLLMAIAALITILFSYYTAKRIADPYKYLTKKIERIASGNYDVTIDSKYFERRDEVGVLSKTVQQMIDTQRESFRKIKEYNLNLEQLIEERTHELKDTNLELEASVAEVMAQKEILELTNHQLELSLKKIKETRAQLIETEKIASSRHLAIGIAHNLNTPIGNTLMLSTYLEEKIQSLITKVVEDAISKKDFVLFLEESNTIVSKVLANLSTCTTLINRFKEFTNSTSTDVIKSVLVASIVEEQVNKIRSDYPETTCQFTLDIDESLTLSTTVSSLQKLFYELLANSFIHAFVLTETHQIIISARRKNTETIAITYEDNGTGLKKDSEKELFTPLYTSSLATNYGLGLSVIHRIIKALYRGSIEVIQLDKGLGYSIELSNMIITEEGYHDEKINTDSLI